MNREIFLLAAIAMVACSRQAPIENMKCDYLTEPICIDTPEPHFSWTYTEDFVEAGSKIEIAESESELGKGENPALKPLTSYVWRVTAWNRDSSKVLTSPVAHFETAMFNASDWRAEWISDTLEMNDERAPMLRKVFSVEPGLMKARLYVSAAAYAEVFLNGDRTSESRLDPGYTEYDKRNLYSVYDVTSLLKDGENCIGVVLGNGFYNEIKPVALWHFERAAWRGRARFIAEVHLTYDDGREEVVASDSTWTETADGPYLRNNIYAGDTYDARREIDGWDKSGFDDSGWAHAVVAKAPSATLTAQKMAPIEPVEILDPVAVKSWGDTMFVFDFGKNISGVCEISVTGDAGTKVSIRHGEIQNEDGTLYMGNIGGMFYPQEGYEFQTDFYYLKGVGQETWRPSFTYHGFQYAEVKTDNPIKLGIKAVVMHSDVGSAGEFSCSDEMFNTLWDMARRTYLNNLYSILTDCPQREKNGWTADNFLTVELALLDFDIAPYFFSKWSNDVVDNINEEGRVASIMPDWGQGYGDFAGVVWDASIFTIAEQVYDYTGDISIIRKLWPVYKKYLAFLQTRENEDGYPVFGLGDWVFYNAQTGTDFVAPCFYFKEWNIMARFAQAMSEDPGPYAAKAAAVRDTINHRWFDPSACLYSLGTQAAQGIPLYLGIVPDGKEQAVADNLARMVKDNGGFMDFGSFGSKTVPRMLTKYGHFDTAYEMAAKDECPSWGVWVKRGLSTLPETWNAHKDNTETSSLNHAFLGDIAAWYVNDIAGINPGSPGFGSILIKPHFPSGLEWAQASYDSVRGTIRSSWKRKGDTIELSIDIPFGTTATLVVDGGTGVAEGRIPLHQGHNRIIL